MKRICVLLMLALIFTGPAACTTEKEYPWNPNWNEPETEKPVEPENPDPDRPAPEKKSKPRYIWIDASANFKDYANSIENIARDMKHLAESGFTDVIVDVRPSSTGVLFKSDTEKALTRAAAWIDGNFQWVERTADFDYLQAFIDKGHEAGLKVNAAINTFTGGCLEPYGLGTTGMLYDHPERKSWATVFNAPDGLTNVMDVNANGTRFLNPANDEVTEYLLSLIGELASYKDLDGIVLDRCRYDDHNLQSDFSEISRKKFEKHIGRTVKNFPDDIFSPGAEKLDNPVSEMQKKWLEFRAKTIHDFIEKAADRTHKTNPDIRFGAYVGGWYSTYYMSGVNWASPKYDPLHEGGYKWATADYMKYGYADHCDFMFIGAYAGTAGIWGSGEWTMQGFCRRAKNMFKGDVPFAGGPDIGNGSGFEKGGCGYLLPDIVDACINSSDGLFIFDLIHLKMYDYWDDFKVAIDKYLETL